MIDFLNTLFGTASSFAGDLYGLLLNQVLHAAIIGLGLAWSVGRFFKDRLTPFLIVAIGYIAFEIGVQGWQGLDTLFDVLFVWLGASASLGVELKRAEGFPRWLFWTLLASIITVPLALTFLTWKGLT